MRLRDLIDELEEITEKDGDECEVLLLSQADYPFENSIKHVIQRMDISEDLTDSGTNPTDVFLVEGIQLRYGSKRAWER